MKTIEGISSSYSAAILEILIANPGVERIVLFGSRATGNARIHSDIDLMLYGETLTLNDLATLTDKLLDLPLPQTVDLHLYHRINSSALLDEINRHGIELYHATEPWSQTSKIK
ncbi:nucleotidyltransferase domain-containing protein [bacterium]|nr:nucleotidyltransferase domain-containing protein [bacterium]